MVKDDIKIFADKKLDISTLTPEINIDKKLKAPIATNSVVGKITYSYDGEEYSSDLIAETQVIASGFYQYYLELC